MRSGPAAIVCSLLAAATIMVGCGGGDDATAGSRTAAAAKTAPAPSSRAEAALARKRCGRLLGEFLDSAESLDNTLAVGLDYRGYLSAVDGVRSTYAAVPAERLPLGCLARVGAPAERALNAYVDAVNTWGGCLATAACNPESIEAELQRKWAGASRFISLAQSGLRGLG